MAKRGSRVEGAEHVAAAFRIMADAQRPVSEASRYGLSPVLKDSKANLQTFKPTRYEPGPNVVTGELKRSMVIRKNKARKGYSEYVVAAQGKARKKAHLVEFGTDPHYQPKRRRWHPGAQPFPFLTPAFEKNRDAVVDRFGDRIILEIEKQAERIRSKQRWTR